MLKEKQSSQTGTRGDVILAALQVVFALLLCAIYAVFVLAFGGEFLIVVKGQWILPIFLVLLLGGAIYSTVMAIRSRRTRTVRDDSSLQSPVPATRKAWLLGVSLWNCIAAVLLVLVGKVLALGALGSVPGVLIGLLALPFAGYAVVLAWGSVKLWIDMLRRQTPLRLLRGAVTAGLAFLFLFGAYAIVAVAWDPQWSEGVAHAKLFVPGEEPGRGYRIPAMIVLQEDHLLAFAESRVNAMSDLLDIDLVMKRSFDGGKTWDPIQVLRDEGSHTIHSPCPVYDQDTGTVWLPFCRDYERLYLMQSTDGGTTWTQPRDMNAELGIPGDVWCHNGPGNGIQMATGRLVIPTSVAGSRVLYSDDHGATWVLGEAIGNGGEPQVFERADGALCANLRSERGSYRIVACSDDGGETWGPWEYDEELPAAGTQASVMRFTSEETRDRNRVLFSNPGQPYRGSFTIRMSYDEGETWEVSKLVYEGAAGYSQLAVLSDHTILALFEAGVYDLRESITLIRVDLDWLTDGGDSVQ